MKDTEELIRAALVKGAKRAPHPGQIINALNTRRPRRRRSMLVAVIGTAAVIAAITVPIAVRQSAEPTPPSPPATQDTPPPAAAAIPMKYKVADLPPDYVEQIRTADYGGGAQMRGWSTSKDWTIHLSVHTRRSPRWSSVTRRSNEPVSIGGTPGWVMNYSGFTDVVFTPDNDTAIVVQAAGGPDTRARAISAANSVRPDGVTVVSPELSFGTLPAQLGLVGVMVMGSSPATGESWTVAGAPGAQEPSVRARVVPKDSAKLFGQNVVVPTPDGRDIELIYNGASDLTEQQAREIAQGMTVEAKPDLSWLGK
jgi:hypothetical protein